MHRQMQYSVPILFWLSLRLEKRTFNKFWQILERIPEKTVLSKVFIINQGNSGLFDEHKILLGYSDINEAKEAFLKEVKNSGLLIAD